MNRSIIILCALLPLSLSAQDLSRHVKVKSLYIETERRITTNREYYLRDYSTARHDVNLGLDLDLPVNFYYNNLITSITDTRQFRHIGYEFEVGHRPMDGLEVYFKHFSGHALDEEYNKDFPQTNKVGVRFVLWKR